jgi:ligand-binding sensor domain-containing protein
MVRAVAEVHDGLWIGTTPRGLLRYDAADRTWRQVAFPAQTVRSLVVDTASAAVWATVNGAGYPDTTFSYLYVSTNCGETWEPRDGGFAAQQHFHSDAGPFAIDPSNHNHVLLGIPRGVALSEDGAVTWDQVVGLKDTMLTTMLAYDALAISPADGRRVWVGGTNLMFGEQFALGSDDGGRTWRETSRPGPPRHGTVTVLLPHSQDLDVVLAAVWRSLQETRDGGGTWRTVLELAHAGRYVHAFAATDTMLVAVSDEWVSDWVPGVLGVYTAPAHEGPWTAVPTPPDAAAGWSVMVDHQGQIVIGTTRGVWLVRD